MAERSLIFNANGVQLGYIEGNTAFDLTGRERCNYAGATGNLCDSNNGKIIGHISLDGVFVGASWIADELFGKPSGEVHADRNLARMQRTRHRPKKESVPRPENVQPRTVAPQWPEDPVAHSPTIAKSAGEPEAGLSTREPASDQAPGLASGPHQNPNDGTPNATKSSPTENELLDRAIGMIRSALQKGPQ